MAAETGAVPESPGDSLAAAPRDQLLQELEILQAQNAWVQEQEMAGYIGYAQLLTPGLPGPDQPQGGLTLTGWDKDPEDGLGHALYLAECRAITALPPFLDQLAPDDPLEGLADALQMAELGAELKDAADQEDDPLEGLADVLWMAEEEAKWTMAREDGSNLPEDWANALWMAELEVELVELEANLPMVARDGGEPPEDWANALWMAELEVELAELRPNPPRVVNGKDDPLEG